MSVGVAMGRRVTLRVWLVLLPRLTTVRRFLRAWRRFLRLCRLPFLGIFPPIARSLLLLYLWLPRLTWAKRGPPLAPPLVLLCALSLIFPLITVVFFDEL